MNSAQIPQSAPLLEVEKVSPIEVLPVTTRRQRARFVDLPRAIYAGDPAWVEPLRIERLRHLSPKNPFFQHASGCLWIATRGGRDVGRISAQIDRLHLERHGQHEGFFGMLDAEDDPAIFAALFEAAETWLRERGMQRILGPFNFSINEDCGLLIEGFDTPPLVMMPHGLPHYARGVEASGYSKAQDLLAYRLDAATKWQRGTGGRRAPKGLHLRPLSKERMASEVAIVRELFNDAWSNNWGFVPFTDEELQELSDVLKHIVPADFVWFAEQDGQPVGFVAALPNLNEAIADLRGRLLPFRWAKLLWRMKLHLPGTARIALLGLRQDLHRSLRGARVVFQLLGELQQALLRRGVHEVELSWVLEDNDSMRAIIGTYAADPYKRYRIYSKELC